MSTKNFMSFQDAQEIFGKVGERLTSLSSCYKLRGSVAFDNLPSTLLASMVGYVYNISDDFTTDSRFIEGTGKDYPAGTNISIGDFGEFTEVTPVGNENPSEEGWYEYSSQAGDYIPTEDTEVNSGKTYYEWDEDIKFDVMSGFIDVSGIEDRIDNVREMISDDEFDATAAYEIGDIVVYEDGLYRFTSAHTANTDWDATEVEEIDVLDLIDEAEPDSLTTAQINALLALLD